MKPERIKENFDILDFTLSAHDMARIKTRDTDTSLFLSRLGPQYSRNRKMVHAVQKCLNINKLYFDSPLLTYIKKLFVYAFIVIRHVLSKCFACLLFEEAHEMARIREIEIIRHFTDSAVGE